jgi:8-oxo-dGTP pyrophosphatase MutT (NUDIX family)
MEISYRARVLLLNKKNELLLMLIEDFDIGTLDGKKNKRFWCTVGGGIEGEETVSQAALREIHEETGIEPDKIKLGPIVWSGYVDLVVKGVPTRFFETYIVAKTKQREVALHNPTEDEKLVVKKLQWFSLRALRECPDVIFPEGLPIHITPIMRGQYSGLPLQLNHKR